MRIICCMILVFVSLSIHGQVNNDIEKYKKLYPNEGKVQLKEEIVYRLQIEKGQLKITQEVFEEDLLLNESATLNTKRSLSYSTFFNLKNIKATTLNPSANSYTETPVSEFKEKNDLDDVFYDDSKRVSFLFPNLQKGSKTQLRYTYEIKNPRFLNTFYLGDYYPKIQTKVTFIAHKNIELKFLNFHTEDIDINFSQKKKGKNIIYQWETNNSKAYTFESGAPSFKTILPHVIPIIKSYKAKGETHKVLDNVGDLYNWYYSLVKDINKEPADPDLVKLVENLTKDKTSNLEKVKSIYYWTQQNIKYIAFEYALGGFIPREANDVFNKKYGDCKDNSNILHKMLEIAGLKGHLTWIGTREIPYTYKEVPTPVVDNHMILTYEENGKTYYLDATGRYTKIEYPSAFIQGKEALVSLGPGKFTIKKVPVVPAHMNQNIDSTYIEISEKGLKGKSRTYVTGYPLNSIYYRLERIKKEPNKKSYYNAKFSKGNNSFLISDYKEHNTFSYDKDFYIDYDFTIQNYVQNIGSEIFVNPHLNRVISELKTKKDRKRAVEYEFKKQLFFTNTFVIPENYTVEYLPKNINLQNEFVSFSLSYQKTDKNTIVTNQKVTLDTILLSVEEQKKVNDLIKKAEKAYKEIIILKKK